MNGMKIAVIGRGIMGKLVERLALDAGHEIAIVINRTHGDMSPEDLAGELKNADVAIDFTTADAVRRNIEACVAADVPIVEGTTGWNGQHDEIKRIIREGVGACVYGANFSIGVN